MKKLSVFFSALFFLLFSAKLHAQTPPSDYFAGKWTVLVEGTPSGDKKMMVNLERKDGKLTGAVLDENGKETARISKVEEKEKSVTVYFTSSGYNVYLFMEKKDDDHFTGSLMDMFDAKGDRVKEKA